MDIDEAQEADAGIQGLPAQLIGLQQGRLAALGQVFPERHAVALIQVGRAATHRFSPDI